MSDQVEKVSQVLSHAWVDSLLWEGDSIVLGLVVMRHRCHRSAQRVVEVGDFLELAKVQHKMVQ